MFEDLYHVVAGTETEFLERHLQRHRAGSPEAGPDDLHPELALGELVVLELLAQLEFLELASGGHR